MKNLKIIATGLGLLVVIGGGGFVLGQTVQNSSTNTTIAPIHHSDGENGAPGQWGVYPVDDYFFGGSSNIVQIGLQCVSTKKAVIPKEGTESVRGGPDSLWTQIPKEYSAPSEMHILQLAVVSPCDPSWAYVAIWQNPNDPSIGFQNGAGPAHFYNGKWIINLGSAGQWRGVPNPVLKSFGIAQYGK